MSDFAAPVLELENDPDDALLLRVDLVGGDPLSLAAFVGALELDRLSKAAASDSRPPVSRFGEGPPQREQTARPELASSAIRRLRGAGVAEGLADELRVERAHAPLSAEPPRFAPLRPGLRPGPAESALAAPGGGQERPRSDQALQPVLAGRADLDFDLLLSPRAARGGTGGQELPRSEQAFSSILAEHRGAGGGEQHVDPSLRPPFSPCAARRAKRGSSNDRIRGKVS